MQAAVFFHATCAGTLAGFPLARNVSPIERRSDRKNAAKSILKAEELLVQLPMRRDEVGQHW